MVHEVPVDEPLYKASRHWYQDVTYKIDSVKITGKKSESFKDVIWVEVHSDRLVIGTRKGKRRRKFVQVIPLGTNDRVSVTESAKKESMWDFEHPK